MDEETRAALETAAETITVLRGVVEGLRMELAHERDEKEGLALTLESLRADMAKEEDRPIPPAEGTPTDDVKKTLAKKLAFYYRDMKQIDPKAITAEDGETLYHILDYTFKILKKAGVEL